MSGDDAEEHENVLGCCTVAASLWRSDATHRSETLSTESEKCTSVSGREARTEVFFFFLHFRFIFNLKLCICVFVAHKCSYSHSSEGSVESPTAGVTGSCERPAT